MTEFDRQIVRAVAEMLNNGVRPGPALVAHLLDIIQRLDAMVE